MMGVVGVIIFAVLIALVSYFNIGAKLFDGNLKNSNTAKVLMTRAGKDHTNTFVRKTREESLAEAIELKEELQSDESQTTPWYNSDGEDDLITTMPMLNEDSVSLQPLNAGSTNI